MVLWKGREGRVEGERTISFPCAPSDVLSALVTSLPHPWPEESQAAQPEILSRSMVDSGPRWLSRARRSRSKGERSALLEHPLRAPPRSSIGARPGWARAHFTIAAVGNVAGSVPTGLPTQGGTSYLVGRSESPRQNTNYCCIQSPTSGGCPALPRKSK